MGSALGANHCPGSEALHASKPRKLRRLVLRGRHLATCRWGRPIMSLCFVKIVIDYRQRSLQAAKPRTEIAPAFAVDGLAGGDVLSAKGCISNRKEACPRFGEYVLPLSPGNFFAFFDGTPRVVVSGKALCTQTR